MKLFKTTLLFFLVGCTTLAWGRNYSDSVRVYNAGVNGNSTTNLLTRLERDVLSKSPELVVLMVGTNDMLHTDKSLSMAQYEANYQKLISSIRKKSDLVLMTIPPIYAPYVIQRKPQFNGDEKAPQARVDSANQVIRRLAAKNKCTLIDLNAILTACGGANTDKNSLFQNEANFNIADGIHPTAAGYQVIATAVYQTIKGYKPGVHSVMCFGDSITNGYRITGQGTTEGDVYPAVLKRMLNL
ncbi:SGNH/GDSL hydrolase family protein [Flavisolibacter tropicus]|uniref:SGNH/GDSL hydrolase family protein n=1 Tax=Flavisolibacter tropicus TaxID=1492898 RepID=UPI0008318526|nr:SGNH/GDSL hydrolase family protein [Flavisolibacter tropicus]